VETILTIFSENKLTKLANTVELKLMLTFCLENGGLSPLVYATVLLNNGSQFYTWLSSVVHSCGRYIEHFIFINLENGFGANLVFITNLL